MSSKTVHKALDVLEMFTNETPSWGLRELARAMGLNHTVVHRILTTFEERGYLFRHPESQKYELGLGIVQLSELVDERYQLSSKLDIIMKRITHETNESSVFTVLDNDHGVFLKIVESSQKVRFAESVGRRSPLYVAQAISRYWRTYLLNVKRKSFNMLCCSNLNVLCLRIKCMSF